MSRARHVALAALVLASTEGSAFAQARNVPLGGRSAAMGASIAEGHDQASPLVNPAGVAGVSGDVLGLSASLHAWSSQSVDGFNVPGRIAPEFGNLRIDEDSFRSSQVNVIPSSVAYFHHVDLGGGRRLSIGGAALVPVFRNQTANASLRATDDAANGAVDRSTAITEQHLDVYVGPTAALALGDRFRVGASLFGLYRSRYLQTAIRASQSSLSGNASAFFDGSSFSDTRSTSVLAVVGAQAQPIRDVWVGLSLSAPSVGVSGTERHGKNESGIISAPPLLTTAIFDTTKRNGKSASEAPMRLGFGVAYVRPGVASIAADAQYRFARGDASSTNSDQTYSRTITGQATRRVDTHETRSGGLAAGIDFAVGAELFVGSGTALQAGYTRFADARARRAPTLDALHEAYRDVQMITGGVTFSAGAFETTVGGAMIIESGEMYVRDLYSSAPQPDQIQALVVAKHVDGRAFMLLLSGAVSREQARSEVRDRGKQLVPSAPVLP